MVVLSAITTLTPLTTSKKLMIMITMMVSRRRITATKIKLFSLGWWHAFVNLDQMTAETIKINKS